MSRRKEAYDENLPVTPQNKSFTFVDGFAPKKPHLSAKNTCQFTSQEIQNIQQDHEAQQLIQVREKEELVTKKKDELTLSSWEWFGRVSKGPEYGLLQWVSGSHKST